ncbi:MAG: sigma-54-dependent transcriptional regulator [Sphaerochaeta sp.]|uniref:sigma-54-dependent transcriptional regulator n=1 Tax=Sphaerochaeta sp. TaxID=1972642 RepID=UPI002FC698DC
MSLFILSSDWRLKEKCKLHLSHSYLREFTIAEKLFSALEQEQPEVLLVDCKLARTTQRIVLSQLQAQGYQNALIICREGGQNIDPSILAYFNPIVMERNRFNYPLLFTHLAALLHETQEVQESVAYHPCGLIGDSDSMALVREQLVNYAKQDCAVHLFGETGTGKEVAANYLHTLKFPSRNIVSVNCSILSDALGNSMFFGHAKGAFTDGRNELEGFVQQADRTTLFLDEVETLSVQFQGHLLRLFESGQYHRYGDTKMHVSDFRLITASNEKLSDLVDRNAMRKDFFYRISDANISLPPLRDHKEDIPKICSYFLSQEAPGKELAKEDLPLLQLSNWPGNVRQLFSTLRRSVIKSGEDPLVHIDVEDLLA